MSNKSESQLVNSVHLLDGIFNELERVGGKISTMDLKTEQDLEHGQRLFARFAELGESVAAEVTHLSVQLNEARVRAEAVAKLVAERAEVLNSRRTYQNQKMEEFRVLGEKVRDLSDRLAELKRPDGGSLSQGERAELMQALGHFEAQLAPLIAEAEALRRTAQEAKMKTLTKNADSLTQTLQAVQKKLQVFAPAPSKICH